MIRIAGIITPLENIVHYYSSEAVERTILEIMTSSSAIYEYSTWDHLKFELDLRASIISASRELHRSGLRFRVFSETMCNPKYWTRTDEGGFLLKQGVLPSAAISDIFENGSKYGTECATAIVIVYYKAILNIFPKKLFNDLFSRIYLMSWKDLDPDLGIRSYRNPPDYFPGDCRYIKNHEVDPKTPEWQGENAIDLGDGTYYGHGIGITTINGIIHMLNEHRISGSTVSASLLDSVTRPGFKHLANRYLNFI